MRETSSGPSPLPKSSSTVCSANATPRVSGSFTFSRIALHSKESSQARLGEARRCHWEREACRRHPLTCATILFSTIAVVRSHKGIGTLLDQDVKKAVRQ